MRVALSAHMDATEEAGLEVEALEAIYGDTCTLLERWPPHVEVDLKPHTGEDETVQFVQGTLVMKASPQYPDERPEVELRRAKGLGDERHLSLLSHLREWMQEQPPGPILVALCEEAKEQLTAVNEPEGDCCFCREPLVGSLGGDPRRPFMKLLSCFHCFHSECFARWWQWELQQQAQARVKARGSSGNLRDQSQLEGSESGGLRCPICRAALSPDDVAHVKEHLAREAAASSAKVPNEPDRDTAPVPEMFLTQSEKERRASFAAEFEAQKARGGIIIIKRDVITPGTYVERTMPPLQLSEPLHPSPALSGLVRTSGLAKPTGCARATEPGSDPAVLGSELGLELRRCGTTQGTTPPARGTAGHTMANVSTTTSSDEPSPHRPGIHRALGRAPSSSSSATFEARPRDRHSGLDRHRTVGSEKGEHGSHRQAVGVEPDSRVVPNGGLALDGMGEQWSTERIRGRGRGRGRWEPRGRGGRGRCDATWQADHVGRGCTAGREHSGSFVPRPSRARDGSQPAGAEEARELTSPEQEGPGLEVGLGMERQESSSSGSEMPGGKLRVGGGAPGNPACDRSPGSCLGRGLAGGRGRGLGRGYGRGFGQGVGRSGRGPSWERSRAGEGESVLGSSSDKGRGAGGNT